MRLIWLSLILVSGLIGAFERLPLLPNLVALGMTQFGPGRTSAHFLSHPASLASSTSLNTAAFYGKPFSLTDLSNAGAVISAPWRYGNVGIGFYSAGNKLYGETTFALGLGRRLGQHLDFGLLLAGHELSIVNYGSQKTVSLSASIAFDIQESVTWSMLYQNLNAPRIGASDELLPQVIVTGFSFTPSSQMSAIAEFEKDLQFDSRYKFGLQWKPIESFTVMTGFATSPTQVTAGIRLKIIGQEISYAIANHPELNLSHILALTFSLP
ncbi:MAG: hypothetical protein QF613_01355 [Candidatus Marinimicrobia bacterium]|jgi:hypothetical protein|nr:hypothetical protein [Candidatus Neomarinimicrobiota bacterium]MDP6592842.1 hypothetical protein [Candidatus Neomarinimicrobiota bacterium]MDP6835863.1 hypothetical protein [Candidatus Neomarinimicrobiota bacterium]MDP6965842.1 hypothetical protein [Candidatus Neomarinimicrobiota bacterium]|tara:strand:+ start:11108 stop:11911 length:804 start_codon:yes stop_codon:yes gene_type:complete